MAEPVAPVIPGNTFAEHILSAADGDDGRGIMPLPVYRHPCGTLTRWAFTPAELAWIRKHGCIYVNVASHMVPPIKVLAEPVGIRAKDGTVVVLDGGPGDDPLERLASL